jgi:hypothetical protein
VLGHEALFGLDVCRHSPPAYYMASLELNFCVQERLKPIFTMHR